MDEDRKRRKQWGTISKEHSGKFGEVRKRPRTSQAKPSLPGTTQMLDDTPKPGR